MTRDEALGDFARRVILNQPGEYVRTVGRDVLHYFAPGRGTGRYDWPVGTWRFGPEFADVRGRFEPTIGGTGTVVAPLASILEGYQSVVYTAGPLLALMLVLGIAGIVGRVGPGPTLRLESLVLAAAGLALIIVPAATVLFDYRYVLPVLVLLPPAGILGGAAVASRVRAWWTGVVPAARGEAPAAG